MQAFAKSFSSWAKTLTVAISVGGDGRDAAIVIASEKLCLGI